MYTFYLFFVSLSSAMFFLLYLAIGVRALTGFPTAGENLGDIVGMVLVAGTLWWFHWRRFFLERQRYDENHEDMLRFYATIIVGITLLTVYYYASSAFGALFSLASLAADGQALPRLVSGVLMTAASLPAWLYHFGVMRELYTSHASKKTRVSKPA